MNASNVDQKTDWPSLPPSMGEQSAAWFVLWLAEIEWRVLAMRGEGPKNTDPKKLFDELKKATGL